MKATNGLKIQVFKHQHNDKKYRHPSSRTSTIARKYIWYIQNNIPLRDLYLNTFETRRTHTSVPDNIAHNTVQIWYNTEFHLPLTVGPITR